MDKFAVVYADPPWDYAGQNQHQADGTEVSSAQTHYPTMTLDKLKALKVADICERDAVLFLWTSSPHLPQAIEVMKAWGFDYKTIAFVWNKDIHNPGYYTISQCEVCLVGKRGQIPKPRGSRKERQFLTERRRAHSQKPDEIRARIGRMFPSQKKIELFAREASEGWSVWGNQVATSLPLEL
jgi:N6-adenosine-specific RNA methylase IME4